MEMISGVSLDRAYKNNHHLLTFFCILASMRALDKSSSPRQCSPSLDGVTSSLVVPDWADDVEDATSSATISLVGGDWRGVSVVS